VKDEPLVFGNAWLDRGFNVIVFSKETHDVLSTKTFDMFGSWPALTESAAMLEYLQGIEDDSIVLIIGEDAVEYWDANIQAHVGDELKAYLASTFGATKFEDITQTTFRDSYGLIGRKGAEAPIVEIMVPAGDGPATLEAGIRCPRDCEPSVAPVVSPVPAPTAVPETGSGCYISQCGCPSGGFALSWCKDANAKISSLWCNEGASNCARCSGNFCLGLGPPSR